ncbi:MAG: hypothetical protein A3G33_08220 [Omnitrophica bacterium RIFCSPLOWO2_12_FULL_44_17]|uniref:Cytoplasmic protein n=1 Tax=Candidatus Danuiimicrobium aquiferis TaxID=1801832 RepID=A0A1G1KW93_9BACT|nr:MAG: hypothetical protein A3B72_03435 [Omnitrophica bacterium RIFCSPHIGHO2_02_FULL_45_28]OGW92608.1 MAG: hypothetical protein A3E74_02465 [Omnitrophica bacterium RIFCSPHIGHO2_12_FULL_44_12]OGW97150.1 MAG: hypothetical protein A3G33_08220 [Omnitrophica bacterium RIFCSPLOWO2_12_FULL_44_17]OGX02210.1 MAG: hypothetical protein A3J12_07995 [Omnitrophica bacterium RIFCSPLOWO2_02_FULL_44_11]
MEAATGASDPNEYRTLISDLILLIEKGRKFAIREVNTALMVTHWFMGRRIVEYEQKGKARAEYGEALLERLGQELASKYGKGFSERNLKLMRQFYIGYPIRQSLIAESEIALWNEKNSQNLLVIDEMRKSFPLSWTHYVLLIRIEDPQKRSFYEILSIQNHWSVRQLSREIDALLYERTSLSKRKELVMAKANENPIIIKPEDEIKDSYILDFLDLKNEYSESELEDALVRHIEQFLLELGRGFTFVARQKRFVLDGDEYRIDLLLFNIALRSYFVIELKLTKFSHAHAGQINFYVNWVRDHMLPHVENGPFGIILCSEKNNTTVKYATGGLSNKIFVSQYLIMLPKPEEFQREIEQGRNLFLQNRLNHETNIHHANEKSMLPLKKSNDGRIEIKKKGEV